MSRISEMFKRQPRLLLHICCAGCGVYVSKLLKQNFEVILFFYNPNIWPREENNKRLEEAARVAKNFKLKIIKGESEHGKWLELVKGHEGDQERGGRCLICYRCRLEETARQALGYKCGYFSTTMTTSPHKEAVAINKIGQELAADFEIKFLSQDFKQQDGFKKSSAMSRELGLYRQNYCGCEFSRRPNA